MEMIVLRAVHILGGVFWAGGLIVVARFVEPSARAMGPDGRKFMLKFAASGFPVAMMISAILVILAGLRMYDILYVPSDGWAPHNRTTWALCLGAATAIIAVIIGIVVSRPTADRMAALSKAIDAGGGKPTDEQSATTAVLGRRLVVAARLQAALVVFTVLMMAIARYLN